MNEINKTQPRDFVLVGAVSCGKTALMRALLEIDDDVLKTQAPVFHGNNVIDTPGEFTARPNYYGALLCTVSEVATIVYLQPANSAVFSLPPGLLHVYPDKNIVGVISKIDLPDADTNTASQVLKSHGIEEPYFLTSAETGAGVSELRHYLYSLCANAMLAKTSTKAYQHREHFA
ncbi:MAG: EutP/PduV family microcompartment system protein [Spongiibacteraceae bacterium]